MTKLGESNYIVYPLKKANEIRLYLRIEQPSMQFEDLGTSFPKDRMDDAVKLARQLNEDHEKLQEYR